MTGGGGTVGNAIVDHPDIALITFTGSPEVGWGIRGRAARKKVGLELGNNAPLIIEPSADIETAAKKVRSRVLPRRPVVHLDPTHLRARVGARALPRRAGPARGRARGRRSARRGAPTCRPLISTGERDRVQSWVDEAVAGGAEILAGGKVREDGVLAPTVLGDVTPDMKVCTNEVFGPVVGIATYRTLDEALRLANDSRYGLQAAIFTADLSDALQAPPARSTTAGCW